MQMSPLEQEIASGKPVVTVTVGDSMEPLLYNRDTRVVIIKKDSDLLPGDLPVYKRPDGKFVMHRIIKADPLHYYTRGDNRCGLECVPKDWVLGVVTEIYRKDRHFSVTDKGYKNYVRLWNAVYPMRWIFYKLRAGMKKR